MRRNLCLTFIVTFTALAILSIADVPKLITYQGWLTDNAGTPVADGNYSFQFQIYDAASAGTVKWNSGTRTVSVSDGLFTHILGDSVPLPNTLFANDTALWLGVTVGANSEFSPRTRLTSFGYAHQALRADTALYALNTIGGSYLPLSGGTMTGPITNVGDPTITMGKGNFGANNTNAGTNAFVAGLNNEASGVSSTVGGGQDNTANDFFATVGGGSGNSAVQQATVGGGYSNFASGIRATIAGGFTNLASGDASTIGGGRENLAVDTAATVAGGRNNRARGLYATVSGGGGGNPADSNSALGHWSTVGGGKANVASNENATVGGGLDNHASGFFSTISGGALSGASGSFSAVGGGQSHLANGQWAVIGGGFDNFAMDTASTVVGGRHNRARGIYATIGGGGGPDLVDSNSASGGYSVISGGVRNISSGGASVIGGGVDNKTTGAYATVGGGITNTASGFQSSVSGGNANIASEIRATVGGGAGNIASGEASTVPGGSLNIAAGSYSFAAGFAANAAHKGVFVWADSSVASYFSSTGANQFLIRATGGVGIGTNVPNGKLHIANADWTGGPVRITGNSGSSIGPTLELDATVGTAGNIYSLFSTNNGAFAGGGKFAIFHRGPTNQGYRMVIDSTGRVGIGTPFPNNILDVEATNAIVADFNRMGNDGIIINLQQAGVNEGTITVAGNTVSYNAFTGSHYGWTDETLTRGELVTLTGLNRNSHDNSNSEVIYGICRSATANDPACLGSYLALSEPDQPYSAENPHLIMAVGNGDMWVTDESGDIGPGDYLISSSTSGHAMKDDEEKYPIGHIVARAAESVDWSSVAETIDGRKHKKISVLFGNFVRSNATSLAQTVNEQNVEIQDLKARLSILEAGLLQLRSEK